MPGPSIEIVTLVALATCQVSGMYGVWFDGFEQSTVVGCVKASIFSVGTIVGGAVVGGAVVGGAVVGGAVAGGAAVGGGVTTTTVVVGAAVVVSVASGVVPSVVGVFGGTIEVPRMRASRSSDGLVTEGWALA